ncbi:MAG: hypothetical protein COV73_03725, partial [Candidatus Omnitrophica bacterium CG11_big_fil_rev_8_21_14_0_20_43_6]
MPEAPVCCPKKNKRLWKNKLFLVTAFILSLVLFSYIFPVLLPFRKILFQYFKSIWWAVTLGLFLGGVIDYY